VTRPVAELAYVAALIDTFGVLRVREFRSTDLPEVTIQGKRIAALDWLAEITGVSVVRVGKDYLRHQCSEHCPAKHTHIESFTRRWQLTGARATIVLHNVEPYMRLQGREARELVEAGRAIGYKGDVVNAMSRLGWDVPALREQPRARIALEVVSS
jgi:hypothetical protein